MLYASLLSLLFGLIALGLGLPPANGLPFDTARGLFEISLGAAIILFVADLLWRGKHPENSNVKKSPPPANEPETIS
jgi:hypothetical protein